MMERFTKGPWATLPSEDDKEYIRIRGAVLGGKYKIADVHDLHFAASAEYAWVVAEREESKANAALIAAAPEMYEMLKNTADELLFMIRKANSDLMQSITPTTEAEPDYYDEQTVFEIMKLLAKARGEQ